MTLCMTHCSEAYRLLKKKILIGRSWVAGLDMHFYRYSKSQAKHVNILNVDQEEGADVNLVPLLGTDSLNAVNRNSNSCLSLCIGQE